MLIGFRTFKSVIGKVPILELTMALENKSGRKLERWSQRGTWLVGKYTVGGWHIGESSGKVRLSKNIQKSFSFLCRIIIPFPCIWHMEVVILDSQQELIASIISPSIMEHMSPHMTTMHLSINKDLLHWNFTSLDKWPRNTQPGKFPKYLKAWKPYKFLVLYHLALQIYSKICRNQF